MNENVICRSNSEYADQPTAILWEGERIEIEEIISRWRSPEGKYFLVRTREDRQFKLFYDEVNDKWHLQPGELKKTT